MTTEQEVKGYDLRAVPPWGCEIKFIEFCGCDPSASKDRSCGCAFGQCAKGLIF